MALTIKFEKAVQAVAPHVSVPYWDFTIDAEEIFLNKDKDLSSYWFQGSVRPTRLRGATQRSRGVDLQISFSRVLPCCAAAVFC
jgi:hypothetical protein